MVMVMGGDMVMMVMGGNMVMMVMGGGNIDNGDCGG